MRRPRVGGAAGSQGVFEAAMHPLHHPVGLWVVGRRDRVPDVEQRAQLGPDGRGELCASVRGEDRRDAETRDPPLKQGICAVGEVDFYSATSNKLGQIEKNMPISKIFMFYLLEVVFICAKYLLRYEKIFIGIVIDE